MITLVYTGPVVEVGFTGPVTLQSYVVRPNEPFQVAPEDAPELLRVHGRVLGKVEADASRAETPVAVEPASGSNEDAAGSERATSRRRSARPGTED